MEAVAVLVATTLLVLALLHAYWGLGGTWPGTTPETLATQVYGDPPGTPPPPAVACYVVTGLLALAAWLVLTAASVLPTLGLSIRLVRLGAFSVASVLLLRGGLGYVLLRPTSENPTFARLNRMIYSPLCLILGALILLSLLG